nr:uncharacterized protein LOC100338882 isoform X1 [Oryctolagus cuniculus]
MAALGGDGLRLLSVSRPERQPEAAALGGAGPGLCCWVSVFSCLSLACSYVGSLYVWKSELPRDHPAVIKRRFTSVLVVSSLSPLCVLLWRELTGIQPGTSLLTLMGVRLEGIFPAALLPLLLTMILFLGPLMQLSMDCPCDLTDGLKVVLGDRPADGGAGVPGLHAAHAGALHRPGPRRVHLPALLRSCPLPPHHRAAALPPEQRGEHLPVCSVPVLLHGRLWCLHRLPLHPYRTPDRAGSLPLFLQLHGLPRRVRSPGAPAEAAPAGRLRPGGGPLPAAAAAPHGPQALRQPAPLCAAAARRELRDTPVRLTRSHDTPTNSTGSRPSPSRGTAGEGLAGVPEISGIFVGD